MDASFRNTVRALLPEIAALRRELHRHPEIRFEEHWTSDRIAKFLEVEGIPHTRGHAKGTGIVACVEGQGVGRGTVLLRADMDALELQEETGAHHASQIPGRMHACGHDGHSAALCGVAAVLTRCRDRFGGRIKLVFQPAEEQASGGYFIAEEGLLDDVDAAFALHTWPSLPAGTIGLREGTAMASADFFRIEIHGKGGHGADPASAIDPIVAAAHVVLALQTLVSRETGPTDAAVVTIAEFHAGTSSNIIPDRAWMTGTCRALSLATREHLANAIVRIAQQTAQAFRATAEITFGNPDSGPGYPPLINDPGLCAFVRHTAQEVLGPEAVFELDRPFMAAEDFAYYLQRVPGVFIFLGAARPGAGPAPALHTPAFDFNDDTLEPAIMLLCSLAVRHLQQMR